MNSAQSPLRDVLLIHWLGDDQPLDWLRIDAQGRIGTAQREQSPPASAIDAAREIIVLAPSESITLLCAALPARQAEQARKAAPFAIEDQIAGNVESLHVAVASQSVGLWWVAAMQPELLRSWLTALETRGLRPDRLLPDVLALEALPDASVVLIDGERSLVRAPGNRAYAVETDLLDSLLASDGEVIRHVPVPGQSPLQILAAGMRHSAGMNLLSEKFASAHRDQDLRGRWRKVFWLAAAVLVLGFGFLKTDEWRLRGRIHALHSEMETIYRGQFPQAQQVPNPMAQMRSALAAASGGSSEDASGLSLLIKSAPILSAQARVQLEGVEYRNGVLTLRLAAPSIDALDSVREGLSAGTGMKATVENADSSGDGIDGRIRLELGA